MAAMLVAATPSVSNSSRAACMISPATPFNRTLCLN